MWLPISGSAVPSLGTSPLLTSELGYNSRLVAAPYPVLLLETDYKNGGRAHVGFECRERLYAVCVLLEGPF